MTVWFFPIVAGIMGLAVGSFLNVCVFRWPQDQSVVQPRSRCGDCGETVRWYDNIPVLSYLILRGRCRWCGTSFSMQYPMVELTTGLIWAGALVVGGPTVEAVRGAIFLTILFGISLTDARFYIIPDQFSLGGLVLGLALAPFAGGLDFMQSLLGAGVGIGLLWGIALLGRAILKKEAMGGGDIKMLGMVGAFLGIQGVFLTLFLGALLGSVIFGPISLKTKKLVPFGIFLAAGAAVTYGWGDAFVDWYLSWVVGVPSTP